jgi:hypothetical protein
MLDIDLSLLSDNLLGGLLGTSSLLGGLLNLLGSTGLLGGLLDSLGTSSFLGNLLGGSSSGGSSLSTAYSK